MSLKAEIPNVGKRVAITKAADILIAQIYNIKILMQSLFTSFQRVPLEKNADLRNIDCSFCFVLGNGPSLTKEALNKIKKYPTFTVNQFHKGYENYNSDFHVCIDPGFWEESNLRNYIVSVYKSSIQTKFIFHKNMKDVLLSNGCSLERAYFIQPYYVQNTNKLRIDMTKIMTGSINIVPVAIECALYMGYKNIYLLGCDMNLKSNHFYDTTVRNPQKKRGFGLLSASLAFCHHYALDDYAKNMGCSIINLTPGSFLDAYLSDDLENVLTHIEEGV